MNFNLIEDYAPSGRTPTITYHDIAEAYLMMRKKALRGSSVAIVRVSEGTIAARIAKIARDLVGTLLWPVDPHFSEKQQIWRELSLRSIEAGCKSALIRSPGPVSLDQSGMALISAITKQTARFFNDFCENPKIFLERTPSDLHEPMRHLVGRLFQKQFPEGTELRLHFDAFCHVFFDYCARGLITPQIITRIVLNIEFPYGEEEGGTENVKGEINNLRTAYPKECEELGQALLDCVDFLISLAENRLIHEKKGIDKIGHFFKKGAIKAGTAILKPYKSNIGAYIFSAINASLKSEGSTILKIIETWIPKMGDDARDLDDKELMAQLDLTIRKDFLRLIKYTIHETPGKNEATKGIVGQIIEDITPVIVAIIWDRKTRPLDQLIYYYLPQASIPDKIVREERPINKTPSARWENIVMKIVRDYLLPQEDETHWQGIMMCSIKLAMRKAQSLPMPESSSHENTLALGFTFAAVNQFLQEAIRKKFTFEMPEKQIEQPLVNYLNQIVPQEELREISLRVVNTCIDTLMNPILIGNLILKIKLSGIAIPETKTSGKEMPGYDAVGLEAVRLLRTILSLGHEDGTLSYLDKLIAGLARRNKAAIGSKIAEALRGAGASNEDTLADLVEKVLWNKEAGPVFFDGWTDNREALQFRLSNWVKTELLPFISKTISEQELWFGGTIEKKLISLVSTIAEKAMLLLFHPENKALRIFLIHFLLPTKYPRQ